MFYEPLDQKTTIFQPMPLSPTLRRPSTFFLFFTQLLGQMCVKHFIISNSYTLFSFLTLILYP